MTPNIQGLDKVVSHLGRWAPDDLAYLVALELDLERAGGSVLMLTALFQRREDGGNGWPNPSSAFLRVRLMFRGVHDLRLSDISHGPTLIVGFEIEDCAGRQWEDVRFRIGDYEDNRISFYCESVEVLEAEVEQAGFPRPD